MFFASDSDYGRLIAPAGSASFFLRYNKDMDKYCVYVADGFCCSYKIEVYTIEVGEVQWARYHRRSPKVLINYGFGRSGQVYLRMPAPGIANAFVDHLKELLNDDDEIFAEDLNKYKPCVACRRVTELANRSQ